MPILEHRADDREEVVRKRVDTYEAMTAELLPLLREDSAFSNESMEWAAVEEVTARILEALGTT